MLKEYKRVLQKVPGVLEPLMAPHRAMMDAALEPGLRMITWTSLNISAYISGVHETLDEILLLIDRANDLINFRILKVLKEIENTVFCEVPLVEHMATDEFLKRTKVRMNTYSFFSTKYIDIGITLCTDYYY